MNQSFGHLGLCQEDLKYKLILINYFLKIKNIEVFGQINGFHIKEKKNLKKLNKKLK